MGRIKIQKKKAPPNFSYSMKYNLMKYIFLFLEKIEDENFLLYWKILPGLNTTSSSS